MDNFPTSQYHFSEVKNPGLKKNTTEEGSRWNQDDTHIHTLAPGAAHGDRTLLLRQGLISRGWAVVVGGPGPSVLGEPSRGGETWAQSNRRSMKNMKFATPLS